jgi:hypothetical protein
MTVKIKMWIESIGKTIDMPNDKNLDIFDAIYRAELYSKRSCKNIFYVVDESNDFDIIEAFKNGERV